MKPILYSFRRCPYAMRARMALTYANIDIEYREIELQNKPQAMLDVSPKGTVPVLILSDSTVIDESLDIMLWALKQHDPDRWLSSSTDQALTLIKKNDGEFKRALDKYKYAVRFPEYSDLYYRAQGEIFFKILEQKLNQYRFLTCEQATLVDYAIFPFVRQFAHVNKTWFDQSPYPKLQQWLEYHLNSSLFIIIMEKKPIFNEI